MAASFFQRALRPLLLLVLFCTVFLAHAQVDNIYVYGTVKDRTSAKKMDGVTVTVLKNGQKLSEVVTTSNGKYEFNLDYGYEYKLIYVKSGIVSRNVVIDTRSIPEENRAGGLAMNVDMTLFSELPGMDFSVAKEPIGKSKYDATTGTLVWDQDYTAQMQSKLDQMFKDYDEKLKREASTEADFKKLMDQGNAAMTSADYKKAVDSYTAALALKAADAIATAKLSDAQMKLNEQDQGKKKEEQYAALIKEADGLFGKKTYEDAKAKYAAASAVKDQEPYPKQQMKQCDAFIADLAQKDAEAKKTLELEAKYKAAVDAGDLAFKAAKYQDAKASYTQAAGLKPTEKYPPQQLAAIDLKLAELAIKADADKKAKDLDANYQTAITAADAAFQKADYDGAKGKYNAALALKPKEKYPTDQLAAIDKKLAELAAKADADKKAKDLDAQYQTAITAADAAFQKADYDGAKGKYTAALALKPKEKYPTDQLAAIDKKLADLAAKADADKKAKDLDAQYQTAITAADAAFQKADYDGAKGKYTAALALKPKEKYPTDQLAAIDKKQADLVAKAAAAKKAKDLDAQYQQVLDQGEGLFTAAKYVDAKAKFQQASTMKPTEARPKERIVEIDAKLAELARQADEVRKQQELDAKFTALIASADKKFDGKKLSDALNDYTDASKLKPSEQYPKDRIAAINGLLDSNAKAQAEKDRLERDRLDKEKRYSDLVGQADKAFTAKKYQDAMTGYTSALEVKPGEQHPTDRLAEIKGLLDALDAKAKADSLRSAQEAAASNAAADKKARYAAAIAKGDAAFDRHAYDPAREGYAEALGISPGEKYPTDRIAAIDKALADLEKSRQDADQAAEKQRLADAERLRREAAAADSAKSAADQERQQRESAKALDENYAKVIKDADGHMGDQDWSGARDLYSQALDIKPKEAYPQTKIQQIDKLIEEKERRAKASALAAQTSAPPPEVKQVSTTDNRKEQEAEEFMREAREREEAEKYEKIKKLKATVDQQQTDNSAKAVERQNGYAQQNSAYQAESGDLYQGSQDLRKKNEAELAAFQAELLKRKQDVVAQDSSDRAQAVAANAAEVAAINAKDATWQGRHAATVAATQQQAQQWSDQMADQSKAGGQRTAAAQAQVTDQQERDAQMQQRGEATVQRERDKVNDQKQQEEDRQRSIAGLSKERTMAEAERLGSVSMDHQRAFADYNRNKLASQYPQGVTEESYTEGNKVIIRRVVVQGNKADEYTKVIAKWGTFYFKNGQSISEQIWTVNTEE